MCGYSMNSRCLNDTLHVDVEFQVSGKEISGFAPVAAILLLQGLDYRPSLLRTCYAANIFL